MNVQELLNYYSSLLLYQYGDLPKATAMIQALVSMLVMPQVSTQVISFPRVPASGSFVLNYGDLLATVSIAWNASTSTIQADLQALSGLSSVTVSGSIASQSLEVTFTGVISPATLLTITSNTLLDGSSSPISPSIKATDMPLPQAIQNAYSIDTAVGAQLDILGKYAGVKRTGYDFSGPCTLSDSDFRSLIKLAILKNNSGSSLFEIQGLISIYFPTALRVFDYADMQMDYMLDSSVGSTQLAQFLVKQGMLPKPMGVQLGALIFAAGINSFFGFRTYSLAAYNSSPFNSYSNYTTNTPWLSYANAISQ